MCFAFFFTVICKFAEEKILKANALIFVLSIVNITSVLLFH